MFPTPNARSLWAPHQDVNSWRLPDRWEHPSSTSVHGQSDGKSSSVQELSELCLEVGVFLPGFVEEGQFENSVLTSLKDRFGLALQSDFLQGCLLPTVDLLKLMSFRLDEQLLNSADIGTFSAKEQNIVRLECLAVVECEQPHGLLV